VHAGQLARERPVSARVGGGSVLTTMAVCKRSRAKAKA
jgi:hypothetical protein